MRFIYNIILIITAFPVLFTFFSIFGVIFDSDLETGVPKFFLICLAFASFGLACSIFMYFYRLRVRWILTTGVYNSWGVFKAYMMEGHQPFIPPAYEIEAYIKWVDIPTPKNMPTNYNKHLKLMKPVYTRIITEHKQGKLSEPQMKSFMLCLIMHIHGLIPELKPDNAFENHFKLNQTK